MTILVFLVFTVYFILCQYVIEKKVLSEKIIAMNLFYLIVLAILMIALSIVIGLIFHIEWFLVPAVTLFLCECPWSKISQIFYLNRKEE